VLQSIACCALRGIALTWIINLTAMGAALYHRSSSGVEHNQVVSSELKRCALDPASHEATADVYMIS